VRRPTTRVRTPYTDAPLVCFLKDGRRERGAGEKKNAHGFDQGLVYHLHSSCEPFVMAATSPTQDVAEVAETKFVVKGELLQQQGLFRLWKRRQFALTNEALLRFQDHAVRHAAARWRRS
jgi:hypothetical protein